MANFESPQALKPSWRAKRRLNACFDVDAKVAANFVAGINATGVDHGVEWCRDDEKCFIDDAAGTRFGHAGTFRARRTFGDEMIRRYNACVCFDANVAISFVAGINATGVDHGVEWCRDDEKHFIGDAG